MSIVEELRQEFRELGKAGPPTMLYHYTSAQALESILRCGTLRATHYRFVNDPNEIRHGLSLVSEAIEHTRGSFGKLDQNQCDLVGNLERYVRNVEYRRKNQREGALYLACFTERRDDLSQFRAYGDRADRFCIGFDAVQLPQLCPGQGAGRSEYGLVKMIYVAQEQKAAICECVSIAFRILSRAPDPNSEELAGFAEEVRRQLRFVISSVKASAFEDEREWRLVLVPELAHVKFDASKGFIRPYVEIDDPMANDLLPVKEIVVGPSAHSELAEESVGLMCARYGYEDVNVARSDIPFRDL